MVVCVRLRASRQRRAKSEGFSRGGARADLEDATSREVGTERRYASVMREPYAGQEAIRSLVADVVVREHERRCTTIDLIEFQSSTAIRMTAHVV
jgi:c-di-GMP-binding flagellar brake protein YcgR